MHLAPEGCPDIVGFLAGGRFLGIEVKAPASRATQEAIEHRTNQTDWARKILASGGLYIRAQSLDDVINGLRET